MAFQVLSATAAAAYKSANPAITQACYFDAPISGATMTQAQPFEVPSAAAVTAYASASPGRTYKVPTDALRVQTGVYPKMIYI
jgi:hypothetical protein